MDTEPNIRDKLPWGNSGVRSLMSGANRGYIFAAIFGLMAISAGAGSWYTASYYGPQHNYPGYSNNVVRPQDSSNPPTKRATVRSTVQKVPCQEPQGSSESELCAQWRAASAAESGALWALVQMILSAAGLVGLLVSLRFTRDALSVARHANEQSQRIGEAQTQAYLSISNLQGQHYTHGLALQLTAKNSGQSPALNAFVELRIVRPDGGVDVRHVHVLHSVPAQSELDFAILYYDLAEAKGWPGIAITTIVSFDTVFGENRTIGEKFGGSPDQWGEKNFTDLVGGRHLASYLRTHPDA